MKKMKLTVVTVVALFGLVYARIKDGLFPRCKRSDPNLSQCIMDGIETVRPILKEGLPEISFPSLEPFLLEKIPIETSVPGLYLRGEATNIVARGAGDFQIQDLNVDVVKKLFELTLVIPRLEVTAHYMNRGSRVLLFTINTGGTFTGTFVNVRAEIKASAEIDHYGKLEYLRLPALKANITFGPGTKMHVKPDDKAKHVLMAAQMTNNAPALVILKVIKPFVDGPAGALIQKYFNKVLDQLPLQDLLED